MEFKAESGASRRPRTDCAVVGVHENGQLAGSGAQIDAALGGRIARITAAGDFAGRLGETLLRAIRDGLLPLDWVEDRILETIKLS